MNPAGSFKRGNPVTESATGVSESGTTDSRAQSRLKDDATITPVPVLSIDLRLIPLTCRSSLRWPYIVTTEWVLGGTNQQSTLG